RLRGHAARISCFYTDGQYDPGELPLPIAMRKRSPYFGPRPASTAAVPSELPSFTTMISKSEVHSGRTAKAAATTDPMEAAS
ncbi:MAG TPA: hypothetical protein VFL57_06410, partial [Bryobacteraceae bacterium]|nr:hypothetical protein [Bryobacteraceae bacterium]